MGQELNKKLKLAVLISGRGSNLQSIIDACALPDFPATIELVISNEPEVQGLERARAAGIKTETIPHKTYPSRREFETALQAVLMAQPIDLICLAGFMRVLTPDFVSKWEGRIVNIHPSLLPAYPGLHVHERVLAGAEKESGCTIHFVTPGLDEGPTLLQKRVPVLPGDTAETLAARVLEQEHLAYPEAIWLVAHNKVKYDKGIAFVDESTPYIAPRKAVPEPPPAPVEVEETLSEAKPAAAPAPVLAKPAPPVVKTPSVSAKETKAMDHHHAPTDNAPDQNAIANANAIWGDFTKAAVYTVILVTVVLSGMAAFLL
jgi:phosphoribosylglycinamide formyltransferase-1